MQMWCSGGGSRGPKAKIVDETCAKGAGCLTQPGDPQTPEKADRS